MSIDEDRLDAFRRALGDELRAARARKDLSQGELGARTGMALATINRFERGHRTVDVAQLIAICSELGVDAGELLDTAQRRAREQ